MWQQISEAVCNTEPAAIVLSNYNHEIEDDSVQKMVGLQDKYTVRESDVFNVLLEQNDYREGKQWVIDDQLTYPLNIYRTSFQVEEGILKWDIPVDKVMDIYYKPEQFPQFSKA